MVALRQQNQPPRIGSDIGIIDVTLVMKMLIIYIILLSGKGSLDTQAGPKWLE